MGKIDLEALSADCMEMISYAGEGRSQVYDALELMVDEQYQEAYELILKAEEYLAKAHEIQFIKLLSRFAQNEEIPCNMLLLHAMDILMSSTSEKDMLKAVINAKIKRRKDE